MRVVLENLWLREMFGQRGGADWKVRRFLRHKKAVAHSFGGIMRGRRGFAKGVWPKEFIGNHNRSVYHLSGHNYR